MAQENDPSTAYDNKQSYFIIMVALRCLEDCCSSLVVRWTVEIGSSTGASLVGKARRHLCLRGKVAGGNGLDHFSYHSTFLFEDEYEKHWFRIWCLWLVVPSCELLMEALLERCL